MSALVTEYTLASTVLVSGGQDWTGIGNVLADDEFLAEIANLSGNAYWVLATGVADTTTIPADAGITGFGFRIKCIQTEVEASANVKLIGAWLYKCGVRIDANVLTEYIAFPVDVLEFAATFGGNGVLGGQAWSTAQATAADSGVVLAAQNVATGAAYVGLDFIEPTIHWIPAGDIPKPGPLSHTHRGFESKRYRH